MDEEEANRQILCDIARAAFEVVNRLLARDQLLARQLRSAETTSRQVYREECITVEMAATLRERFPSNVEITLFTPPEETRTGADWYWRFERGDRSIHARVQAKRVQRTEFGQEDRNGHIDLDLPQLNTLINATNEAQDTLPQLQAWLATFTRFDATPPCGKQRLFRDCSHHVHERECATQNPSFWIAQADDIRNLVSIRRSVTVRSIVEKSVRLDCILPCINGQTEGDGLNVKGFMLYDGLLEYKECVARIQSDPNLLAKFAGAMRIRA